MEPLLNYLKNNSLDTLATEHAITVRYSDDGKLAILTYSQLDSNKRSPVVHCCRGTVIEVATNKIVGRSFLRFFNIGEFPEYEAKFNWSNFSVLDKEDGSLGILYFYDGKWRFNTRGSFAQHKLEGYNGTWEDLFWSLINKDNLAQLPKAYSYSFELQSIWNKVVRHHPKAKLSLLAAFHNNSGSELSDESLDLLGDALGVERPRKIIVDSLEKVRDLLKQENDPTFEGFVLRDNNGLRLKLKSTSYLALHALADNGNLASNKKLVPLVLKGEISEIGVYFPELVSNLLKINKVIAAEKSNLFMVWELAQGIKSQKEFALFINKFTKLTSFLFAARKEQKPLDEIWARGAEEYWVKHVEDFV